MPFVSQAQQRFAFGTDQPWADRWAAETDFGNLPKKIAKRRKGKRKDSGVSGMAIAPTGNNALFNQPGIGSLAKRRKKIKLKACDCGCSSVEKAFTTDAAPAAKPKPAPAAAKPAAGKGQPGELLEPGVRRIRGNLCNVHGRYGPCDGSGGKPKKPKKGRAGAKPPKPQKTDEQRAAERDAKRQSNIDTVAQRMADSDTGLSPGGSAALRALAIGNPIPPAHGDSMVEMGLADRGADGTVRISATGRAAMNAMAAGDYQRAVDTIARAGDTAAARRGRQETATARQTETATRRAAAEAKRQAAQAKREAAAAKKPGKAGAGGGKEPEKAPGKLAQRRAGRAGASGGGGGGGAGGTFSATPGKKPEAPKKPEKPTKEQTTQSNRAAVRDAMAQADQGLAPGGFDNLMALGAGTEPDDIGADGLISMGMAERGSDGTLRLTVAGNGVIRAASRGDAKAAIDLISRANEEKKSTKEAPLFTVYKDDSGADRWLAITTTAYEDKDLEIISRNAIGEVVALGDKTGKRGPLLYWHVAGLPMGDCDFQAQGGPGDRFLIEGGTFRSKAMADLGRKLSASGYQMSPGFIHTDDQPKGGVYDHILIYERSAVPQNRAANYFTRYAAKENKVLAPEKIAEYREKAAGNPEALAMLDTLLETAQKDDDQAQARNVVFKDDAPPPKLPDEIIVGGVVYTVKAFPPAAAEETEAVEVEAEQADDGMAEEVVEEVVEEDSGMDDAAFAQLIAQAVVQALTPLLDIEKKMAGHMGELKTALSGFSAQKDDAAQAQAAQIAALDAKVKELTGDLPDSIMGGARNYYRASESPLTELTAEGAKKIKELTQQLPAGLTDPNEIAAYQLIFGNA